MFTLVVAASECVLERRNHSYSWWYKTLVGGDLDFPKIKKLKNIYSDV